MARADTVNVLTRYYGKNGKGDSFPISLARKRADKIQKLFERYDRVVLLGENVARAFRVKGTIGVLDARNKFCLIPHPSGVNRWYNNKENKELASRTLREALGV
jgi:hypothetical protein